MLLYVCLHTAFLILRRRDLMGMRKLGLFYKNNDLLIILHFFG